MKRQSREVYGYGAKLRTAHRVPFAAWAFLAVAAGLLTGALWN